MRAALTCAHHVLALIKQKLGESVRIQTRFNGGKSIYLFVTGLDPSPVYRLHEKHRKLAEAIISGLPDERRSFIDLELCYRTLLTQVDKGIGLGHNRAVEA
jgi:hypothetical protein